jgi:hypothetical protein
MESFHCIKCNYKTEKYFNWCRHENSNQHKKNSNYNCDICKKVLNSGRSFRRHKKTCKKNPKTNDSVTLSKKQFDDLLQSTLQNNSTTIQNNNNSIQNNSTNNYNIQPINNYNINIFLNDKCKDAMNLTDFIDKIKLSMKDLKYTHINGYEEGISNIIIKNLQDIEPKDRPICCSNVKSHKFFVKDEDKWDEDIENKKIKKSIRKLSKKQLTIQTKWLKEHPNWFDNEKLVDEHNKLILQLCKCTDKEKLKKSNGKILKKVSKCVKIESINE